MNKIGHQQKIKKSKANDKFKFAEQWYRRHARKFDERALYKNTKSPKSNYHDRLFTTANNTRMPSYQFLILTEMINTTLPQATFIITILLKVSTKIPTNKYTSDKLYCSYIDSNETIKPFSDRKITAINNNNCPHRADKGQRKVPLKRSKSYDDSTISNIIVNEINNRKNTNLHFIGYSEWLRCSSYNELASLKWKNNINYVFPAEHPQEYFIGKSKKNRKNASIWIGSVSSSLR